MKDPRYPDGAPDWYKPYMLCEFSDGVSWSKKGPAVYAPTRGSCFPWMRLHEGRVEWFRDARPILLWTPKPGEEVVGFDEGSAVLEIGAYCLPEGKSCGHRVAYHYWNHVARLHNEDGSCIDFSGGLEAIKSRTPWV